MTTDPSQSGPPSPPSPPPGTLDVPVPADSPTSFSANGEAVSAGLVREAGRGGGAGASGASLGNSPGGGTGDAGTDRPRVLRGPRRLLAIAVGIVGSVAISAVAIGILYSHWYRAEQPGATIIVWGPDEWDGAVVTVSGRGLPAGKLEGTVSKEANVIARFHVPPGNYLVRAVKDGRVLGERAGQVQLDPRGRTIWWPFRAPPAATQRQRAATAAAAAATRPG